MRILFLGTGAADWPRTYEATLEQATSGAVRGTSAVLVNENMLIDCGPTVPDALALFGVDVSRITDMLITHTHGDHLDAEAMSRLLAARGQAEPLRIRVESASLARLQELELEGVEIHVLEPGQIFEVQGLTVTALAANHVVDAPQQPLHYLLESQGRRVMYATDGAWLLKQTWLALREQPLDGLIWDATNGETEGDWRIFEHNSVDMIRLMMQTLRREEIVTDQTRVWLTHMARTLCAPHQQMSERLRPEGLVPAHDGLVVDWPEEGQGASFTDHANA
ncbi:MAG: MBL fold metallo-hydrolase [Gemmatimonadetes bacterium]|nr:MBL fold metallo-hydrolase [Gemmatimonadota bacterium]MBT7861725.1 MBL fold metallo-hydrolase [Gemmatimonadota bacterium]